MQVGTLLRQGISLTLGPLVHGRRLLGLRSRASTWKPIPNQLTFRHRGRRPHRIRHLTTLHSACFTTVAAPTRHHGLAGSPARDFTDKSAPSPEVTVPFCLVPSYPEFSQAPWYSLPDHLCQAWVRFANQLRGFFLKHGINDFTTAVARHRISALMKVRFTPNPSAYVLEPGQPSLFHLAFSVPPIAIVIKQYVILTRFPSTSLRPRL